MSLEGKQSFWRCAGRVLFAPFIGLGIVLKSLLTGPDGESYAPGRIMALVLFCIVSWLIIFIALRLAEKNVSINDWVTYLNALMIFVPAMCVAIIGLILGQAPTDAGGKWWGKDASPPPPVAPEHPDLKVP